MRWIDKSGPSPSAIRDYLTNQVPVGHGLDYETFRGSRGKQLCKELTAEQFGLCAYTGCGIDGRIGKLNDPNNKLKFSAHNEHIKAQSICKDELRAAGKTPSIDIGEDMAYSNIVAALMVEGTGKTRTEDLFGAAHHGNKPVPVPPTNSSCETRFVYSEATGEVSFHEGDEDAEATIDVLHLNHDSLKGWRQQAITTFLESAQNRSDLTLIIQKTTTPENGRLPEYCFAIRQVAEQLLTNQHQ
jgi:uncharacterized protein (TIGR02646 family)